MYRIQQAGAAQRITANQVIGDFSIFASGLLAALVVIGSYKTVYDIFKPAADAATKIIKEAI
jgi:hypothetical protein